MKVLRFPSRPLAPFTALLLLTVLTVSASAQLPCQPSYEAAAAAVRGAQIKQGDKQKLLSKIENAWRAYAAAKKNGALQASQQLDLALRQLDTPPTKTIAPAVRADLRQAIQAFKDCMEGGPQVETATLTVRAFLPSDAAPDGRGPAAGPGVIIRSAGVEYGVTGADGTATVQVPAGTHRVQARLYPSNAGEADVTLAAGETRSVDIVLDEGKELTENTTLVLDEAPDGVLSRNFTTFRLRFLDGAATVPLTEFDEVAVDPFGASPVFVEGMFALQADGSLAVTNVSALRSLLLQRAGAIELRVHGTDGRGRTHDRTVKFYLSRFRVRGTLFAPPSFPGLSTSGVPVTATILNTDLVFTAVSDASGVFEFPLLPTGNLEFRSETLQDGRYYYGQGILVLNGDKSLRVNMLYVDDLVAGVPEFTASALAASTFGASAAKASAAADAGDEAPAEEGTPEVRAEREAAQARYEAERAQAPQVAGAKIAPESADSPGVGAVAAAASADGSVSVFAIAGSQNQPQSDTGTLTVPQGTKAVTLTYNVSTAEYPYYVQQQSIYNDTWSLVVRGGGSGQQKFYIPRQINSQLSGDPVWQSSGSTGNIKEELDVEALTTDGEATLTLFASAMNVGDSALATSVNASLGNAPSVQINSVTPDTVRPTTGDSTYYSIPRPGGTNVFERFFTLRFTKPAAATIKRVMVRMGDLNNNNQMMVVLNEGVGDNITQSGSTLRVRVTMHTNASTINSTPPPTWRYFYRFTLVVEENGVEAQDEKDSGRRNPLWRMPDGFARYSTRDRGEDDWCTHGVYLWMEQNRNLLRAINDISGEHARDIDHATHQFGRDIDMYHFYTFPGAISGGDNYVQLRANVVSAAGGNADARARVLAFVNATRTGLGNLAALDTVVNMRYMLGGAGSGLPAGWARDLITTGATTVNGRAFDLNLDDWSHEKYLPRGDHNDHVHIALTPAL